MPKTKPRNKTSEKKKALAAVPVRVKILAAVLSLVLVGGVTGVKYFQSPAGRVVLLDRGFDSYYTLVRDDIGVALANELESFGLRPRIRETIEVERRGGQAFRKMVWEIKCPLKTDLLMVNVALTDAMRSLGAHIRRSEESDGGNTLVFRAGTQLYETHQITIRKNVRKRISNPLVAQPVVGSKKFLAIVIDDFGYKKDSVVTRLLTLDLPLTVSILPSLPHSRYVLDRARGLGRCVLLHLPMEAADPYPSDLDVITVEMSSREIGRVVERYLLSLPGVEGVNNHQGSLATADRRVIGTVLGVVKRHDLFFLDSLTSPKSVAYNTARDLGVPAARNNVFLDDHTEDAAVVEERLVRAVELARSNGMAVAIGHPHQWTLDALVSRKEYLQNAGVELVYVSDLVR